MPGRRRRLGRRRLPSARPLPARRGRPSSSRTRPMTSCGSKGFASTPSHPACGRRRLSTGSNAPVSSTHRNVRELRRLLDVAPPPRSRRAPGMPMSASTMSGGSASMPGDRLVAVADGDDLMSSSGKRQLDDALNRDAVVGQKQRLRHVSISALRRPQRSDAGADVAR